MLGMCIQLPALQTGKERLEVEEYTEGESIKEASCGPPLTLVCAELSDTLGHVQRGQHLLENGPFHIGPSQVGFLEIAARQVTVLQKRQQRLKCKTGGLNALITYILVHNIHSSA